MAKEPTYEQLVKKVHELEKEATKLRQTEKALRDSENQYRTIFETTGTATIIIEEDTTISLANREFSKLSGFSQAEVEGKKSWTDFVAKKEDLRRMRSYHDTRRIYPDAAPRNYEYQFVDKHGNEKDIFATFAIIPGTKKSVGSFLDITEQKRAKAILQESEQQLRFLSSQLLNAQEMERKRIAQELHDGIGQILSAIKFGLEDTLDRLENNAPPEAVHKLEIVIPVIQNGVEEVRRICMDLRPSILDDIGICATISWLCREFQAIYSNINIEQQIDIQEQDIPEELKIIVYRLLQEALNNIAKHSKADMVRLFLKRSDHRIELCVEDNGQGFDLTDARLKDISKRGLGLASMKERTESSGGCFSVRSVPGKGSMISVSWPLSSIS